MKVLIIPSWYPTNIDPIAGSFIADQVLALKRHGVDVAVLFGSYSSTNIFEKDKVAFGVHGRIDQAMIGSGFTLPKMNNYFLDLWCKRYYKLYLQFEKRYGRPDLIHAHSFIAGYFAAYLKAKISRPAILTEHHFEFIKPKLDQNTRYLKIFKTIAPKMDLLLSVSEALKVGMSHFTTESIQVIPNHFNHDFFNIEESEDVKTAQTGFQILAIGSFNENKGFGQLIRALDLVRKRQIDCTLILVGTGPLRKKFDQLISDLALKKKICFYSNLSRREVAALMKGSNVLINSSSLETFGMTILEALACGIPVVSSAVGGPAELIDESNGIILKSRSPKNFADAIQKIFDKYHGFDRFSIASNVRRKFSEEFVIPQIIQVYKRVLSRGS